MYHISLPPSVARSNLNDLPQHDPALLAVARRWLKLPDQAPPAVQRVLQCEQARAKAAGRPYHPPSADRLAYLLQRQLCAPRSDAETRLNCSARTMT
jgi:hypothetical protein